MSENTPINLKPQSAVGSQRLFNKQVVGWILYDFANTIFSMNIITMYFSQWVIVDNHKEDIWYSLAYSISMFLVALNMPVWGTISDSINNRKSFLFWLTIGCVVFTTGIGWVSESSLNLDSKVILALVLFVLANFCYEGGLTFYNALLPFVSTPQNIGKISGWGVGLGYLGAILGLVLVRPFAEGKINFWFFSGSGRANTFIPTALFFLLLSLPTFILVKEKGSQILKKSHIKIKAGFLQVWNSLRNTRKYPGVLRFLIADYFLEDAIATLIIFMAVYSGLVMGFSDSEKFGLFTISTISAILGSFLCGFVTDKIGPKKTLFYVILGWISTLLIVIFVIDKTIFWIFGSLIGIFLGSTWTSSRPLLAGLVPKENLGQFFGLYSLSGRAAAIIGPLLWGGVVLYFKAENQFVQKIVAIFQAAGIYISEPTLSTIQYRFGIFALVLLILIGLFIFLKVPDKHKNKL